MDDVGFIGSDSQKKRGGGPCYQFYCYDMLRLPSSQTLVTIEAGDHYVRRDIEAAPLLAVTSDNVLTSDRC